MVIEYSSQRREVMRWYWKTWSDPARAIRRLLLFGVVVASYLFALSRHRSLMLESVVSAASCGLAFLAVLPLYPLLKFKAQRRVLTTSESGIYTAIGTMSAAVGWSDIVRVAEDGEQIILQRSNGNAFIVPARAFGNASLRAEFLSEARRWQAAARNASPPQR